LLQTTGIAEIEIREGEESVRICRESSKPAAIPMMMPQTMSVPVATEHKAETPAKAETIASDKHTIKAPMVGSVYLSPTPGAKPFVEIGQHVKTGDVICLIEAMKMFNQIEADKTGTITARLIDNGSPVEFGQPLFVIE
jgi:acetyl-CoA carboxylase biotin carboxyl carrier protein